MSSFDNFYNRLQTLNEARKSPVEALVPGATGVTKQMRSAGLSSAPLDTIRFIRELLYNLDVIGDEDLAMVKSGKGFTGKKQAMLKVLQDNQDAINAKSDEIAQTIENTLDNFISGMGVNRSREEKYAAQAAAQELAAQARAVKSGKEMDDALADVISDEKLIIKASLAKVIQELEDLPGGEDISPDVLAEIKKFAPKINTIEQLESFVKQLSAMEEYQLPAAYLSSTVKAIKGGMEDIEMEDQEDPDIEALAQVEVEELGDGELPDDYNEDGETDAQFENILGAAVDAAVSNPDLDYESVKGMIESEIDRECTEYECKVLKSELYNAYGENGDQEKAQAILDLDEDGEREDGTDDGECESCGGGGCEDCNGTGLESTRQFIMQKDEDEEVVAESKYTTADYITDMYSSVKPIVESTVDENGQTTPTEKYLVEHAERAIEEAYTNMYLTEQKAQDSLPKQKKEKSLSFKERFQPKTQWQLEEVRRYGL